MHLDRLRHLASEGDEEAARRLWTEARRRGDVYLAVVAARTLGDAEKLHNLALEGWAGGQTEACVEACNAFGFEVDADTLQFFDAELERINGRRRLRLLRRSDVLRALRAARLNESGYAVVHGGDPKRSKTSLILAVRRPDQRIVAGFGVAQGGVTPGHVNRWQRRLAPWDEERGERSQRWAIGKGDHRRSIVTVDCDELLGDVGPRDRRMASLERILAAPPSQKQWRTLVELFSMWPPGEHRQRGVDKVHHHYREWPPSKLKPLAGSAHTSEHRYHPLYRHLSLDPMEGLAWLEAHPDPTRIRSVELIEHQPRIDAGFIARFFSELSGHPVLENVESLTLRLRNKATLHRLASTPLVQQLKRLEIRISDRLDLGWGKLYAQFFLSCRNLETFELLHRGPLDYIIPALKRVRGARDIRLHLKGLGFARMEQVLTNLRANRIRRLDLSGTSIGAGALPLLLDSPLLTNLERLDLSRCSVTTNGLQTLARARCKASLHTLILDGNALESGEPLASLQTLPVLQNLSLSGCNLNTDALQVLTSEEFPELQVLNLSRNVFGAQGCSPLSELKAPRLTELDVSRCRIGTEGACSLAASDWLPFLARLSIARNGIDDEGFTALVETARDLEYLDAGHNGIGVRGARALASSRLMPRVLIMNGNVLGASGVEALIPWQGLGSVRHLSLRGCRAGGPGRNALERSPQLDAWVVGIPGLDLVRTW